MSRLYKCHECNGTFGAQDVCYPKDYFDFSQTCRYCSHDRYFKNVAIAYILNTYNLRSGEYSDELLDIEIIRAKIRYVMRGCETKYVTFKTKNKMITKVNNSLEMRQALNENLEAIITKKRKLLVAKEINNTLGKILIDVKMELMNNAMTGSKESIQWFNNPIQNAIDAGVNVRSMSYKQKEVTY